MKFSCSTRKTEISHLQLLERPADRKTKSRCRLEIIQTARVVHDVVQLRLDNKWIDRRVNLIQLVLQIGFVRLIEKWTLGHKLLSQTMHVICVIDTERSLDDRKLHDKLNTCRTAQPEIRIGSDRQIAADFRIRKVLLQLCKTSRI